MIDDDEAKEKRLQEDISRLNSAQTSEAEPEEQDAEPEER